MTMHVVEHWDSIVQWVLIPEEDDEEDDDGVCAFYMYFEDGECDRFCVTFDCCGFASIRMVNEEKYGYVMLPPETMSELAKVGRKVRKFFEDKWAKERE